MTNNITQEMVDNSILSLEVYHDQNSTIVIPGGLDISRF